RRGSRRTRRSSTTSRRPRASDTSVTSWRGPGTAAAVPGPRHDPSAFLGVLLQHRLERAVGTELAAAQVEPTVAEALEVAVVVRHQEERASCGEELVDPLVALLPERLVPDREHLVDEQDGPFELGDHGERE